ncbi:APC family permease [Lentzea flaviverrucosa]|uniref:Amino acid transporter n=1 Tax=Lentzea flaviverrucosa TaxID=200379 RepID=A0A1H9EY70_9PSEU|nr:APC family permease [Lentzea flaviverrucosa]RDI35378.1 amino acid transporter [Lentzea flaviverrucosa]SEQ29928.1 Amino acid transporter [Lentzea flaviverrucosa]
MPAIGSTAGPGTASAAGRSVNTPYIVMVIMSMATPMTVFTGIIVIGYAATGLTGIPAAFLLSGLLMSLFYAAYTRMAPLIGNPGSFSGYIAHGLGRIAGVGGAFVALLSYGVLLWGLFGFVGTAAGPLAKKWLGVEAPWWVFALLAWAAVAWLGHRRVRDSARVVAVLLVLELGAIVVFSVTNLLHPADGVITTETLLPGTLFTPGMGALLALTVIGFVGIEAVVVFAKECADPGRTVPRAAQITIAATTVLYAGGSWALSVAAGLDGIVDAARQHGTDLVFQLALPHLGENAVDVMKLLLITSVVAAMIGFQGAGSRYLLALGKEHSLPRWLGTTSPRTGAPVAASRVQSAVTLMVIVFYAVLDIDPVQYLFYWAGAAGALGVLMLMTATAWSTVLYFARTARDTPLFWWVVAGAGALGISWMLFQVGSNFSLVLGSEPGSLPARIIPLVLCAAGAIGVTWGTWLRFTRPADYQAIGQGGTHEIAKAGR